MRTAHETQAANAYLEDVKPDGTLHAQIRAAFWAGIDWNETRCRVCDTVECGTWYCRKCFETMEFGLEGLLKMSRVVTGTLEAAIAKAECFPVSEYVADEMMARGWDWDELAGRMGDDVAKNRCVLDLLRASSTVPIGGNVAQGLACAFGTSASLWLRIDESWRNWKASPPTTTKGGDCRE